MTRAFSLGRRSKRRNLKKVKSKQAQFKETVDTIIPSPELISKELMVHFGGNDLQTMHQRTLRSGADSFLNTGNMTNTQGFDNMSAPGGKRVNKN